MIVKDNKKRELNTDNLFDEQMSPEIKHRTPIKNDFINS